MFDHGERPKLKVPYSALERTIQSATRILLAWYFVYLIVQWGDLPAKVPMHFNGKGEIDRWGSKGELIILPIIGLLIYAGMAALSRFPHIFNYPVKITEENAARQYALARTMICWLNLEIVALFAYIGWASIQAAKGGTAGLGLWFLPVVLVVIFGTLGVYLAKAFKQK